MRRVMLVHAWNRNRFGTLGPLLGRGRGREIMFATLALLSTIMVAGCASTVVKSQYESAQPRLQRPSQIYVYNFAVTRQEVKENQGPLQSTVNEFKGQTTYENEGEIAEEVQTVAADELVERIQNLGLPAQRVSATTPLPKGSLGITGQFLDVDEGNRARRLVIGFGSGQSKVDIRVQLYGYGLDPSRSEPETAPTKLLEFETHADSGSMPGALVTAGAGAAAGAGAGMVVGANAAIGGAKSYRSSMGVMT
ncbi:MAG TPA: DUF4410 domain-containing protein, partial [Nitrospira sp.]|nr:DUF4410 domain-containing protein [Nitrospira sp.]